MMLGTRRSKLPRPKPHRHHPGDGSGGCSNSNSKPSLSSSFSEHEHYPTKPETNCRPLNGRFPPLYIPNKAKDPSHLENNISLALTSSTSLESYDSQSFEDDDYHSLRQLYSTESADTAPSYDALPTSSILSRQAASRIKQGRESHKHSVTASKSIEDDASYVSYQSKETAIVKKKKRPGPSTLPTSSSSSAKLPPTVLKYMKKCDKKKKSTSDVCNHVTSTARSIAKDAPSTSAKPANAAKAIEKTSKTKNNTDEESTSGSLRNRSSKAKFLSKSKSKVNSPSPVVSTATETTATASATSLAPQKAQQAGAASEKRKDITDRRQRKIKALALARKEEKEKQEEERQRKEEQLLRKQKQEREREEQRRIFAARQESKLTRTMKEYNEKRLMLKKSKDQEEQKHEIKQRVQKQKQWQLKQQNKNQQMQQPELEPQQSANSSCISVISNDNNTNSGRPNRTFMDFVEHLLVENASNNDEEPAYTPSSSGETLAKVTEEFYKRWSAPKGAGTVAPRTGYSKQASLEESQSPGRDDFIGGPELPKPLLRRFPTSPPALEVMHDESQHMSLRRTNALLDNDSSSDDDGAPFDEYCGREEAEESQPAPSLSSISHDDESYNNLMNKFDHNIEAALSQSRNASRPRYGQFFPATTPLVRVSRLQLDDVKDTKGGIISGGSDDSMACSFDDDEVEF